MWKETTEEEEKMNENKVKALLWLKEKQKKDGKLLKEQNL